MVSFKLFSAAALATALLSSPLGAFAQESSSSSAAGTSTASAASPSGSSAPAVDVAAVLAHFEAAGILPGLVETSAFTPEGVLNVKFGSVEAALGQLLPQSEVGSQPDLSVLPASNATVFSSNSVFTVTLVDADVVGTDNTANNQTRHWLANNVKVNTASTPYTLDYTTAAITNYAGPGPAAGSGAHRYVLLLIEQPSTFSAPADLSEPNTPLGTFSISKYISSSGLGNVVAASYFNVENGEASSSVSATSAVVSSTLPGFGAAAEATTTSGTGSASHTGTDSHSGSSSKATGTGTRTVGSATGSASASATGSGSSAAIAGVQISFAKVAITVLGLGSVAYLL